MNRTIFQDLAEELALGLEALGIREPTKIQTLAIPRILARKDTFIQSETGTGKTFAYLAPAISAVKGQRGGKGPRILILCPTQELTAQVARQAERLLAAASLPMEVCTLIGGSPLSRQESALKKKPVIAVGTPGRLFDLVTMRTLHLESLEFLVLDECDRLFSTEYRDAVLGILEKAPHSACRILASATIPPATRRLAAPYLNEPGSVDVRDEGVLSGDIEHWVFYVEHRKKIDFIRRLEQALHPARCLVFAASGDRVTKAAERMAELGLPVESLLARQEKEHRRVAIERFETGKLRYLVTSDLGARGLDITGISHVISLDFPEEASGYVHRAGRTGRAGEKGISIVLADGIDLRKAASLAVERNFVFRTKLLSNLEVLEPPVEEFFEMVEAGEREKADFRRRKSGEAGKAPELEPRFENKRRDAPEARPDGRRR